MLIYKINVKQYQWKYINIYLFEMCLWITKSLCGMYKEKISLWRFIQYPWNLLIDYLLNAYMFMSLCGYVNRRALLERCRRWMSVSLWLESLAAVSYTTWMLGTRFWSWAIFSINSWVISSVPLICFKKGTLNRNNVFI